MVIILYRRSYPVADAPVAWSLAPDPAEQRHTFTAAGKVYEAERQEVRVVVPDGAKIDPLKNLLCWAGDKGQVKSTAKEVLAMAEAGVSGFRLE
jgi:hypothetical protein